MKKISAILIGAAMLATLALTGCKTDLTDTNKDIDTDSKKWKGQEKDSKGTPMTVVLSNYDATKNTWYEWTTEEGYVLESGYTFNSTTATFTFTGIEKDTDFVLYISDLDRQPKSDKLQKGKADYRGKVKVYKDAATKIDVKKAPEDVRPMSYLKLTNDEPDNSSVYEDGCYTITELWPLTPKEKDGSPLPNKPGTGFNVDSAMKWEKISIGTGEGESKTKTFLIPAGECIIGIYQPYRDQKSATDKTKAKVNETKNYPAAKICAKWGYFKDEADGSQTWVGSTANGTESMGSIYGVDKKYYKNGDYSTFAPADG